MKTIDVPYVNIDGQAKLPIAGSEFAAGYDLCANTLKKAVIRPHKTVRIGTGLSLAIPRGYYGEVCARSGIATKRGLRPANCNGIIDADYRGEIIVALHNDGRKKQVVMPGERIAQLLLHECIKVNFIEKDTLDNTERGSGGFGSTGA